MSVLGLVALHSAVESAVVWGLVHLTVDSGEMLVVVHLIVESGEMLVVVHLVVESVVVKILLETHSDVLSLAVRKLVAQWE